MLAAGSGHCFSKEEMVAGIAKGAGSGEDVGGGKISNNKSAKEVPRQDYLWRNVSDNARTTSMDWMMKHLPNHYTGNIANLAWMQAVKNKPLNDLFVNGNFRSRESLVASNRTREKQDEKISMQNKERNDIMMQAIIDVDKFDGGEREEGELEEGELVDAESESTSYEQIADSNTQEDSLQEDKAKVGEVHRSVNDIRGLLDTITAESVRMSLCDVCSKLFTVVDLLHPLALDHAGFIVDEVIEEMFDRVQSICSIYSSTDLKENELNKDTLLRLLYYIKDQGSDLFSSDQVKELQGMLMLLVRDPGEAFSKTGNEVPEIIIIEDSSDDSSATMEIIPSAEAVVEDETAVMSRESDEDLEPLQLNITNCSIHKGESIVNLLMEYNKNDLPSPTHETHTSMVMENEAKSTADMEDDETNLPSPMRETPSPVVMQEDAKLSAKPHTEYEENLPSPTRETPTPVLMPENAKSTANPLTEYDENNLPSPIRETRVLAVMQEYAKSTAYPLMEYDENNLPSPTREAPIPVFMKGGSKSTASSFMDYNENNVPLPACDTHNLVRMQEGLRSTASSLMKFDENNLPPVVMEEDANVREEMDLVDILPKTSLVENTQAERVKGSCCHAYFVDAIKAVSDYQQKFGGASFLARDKLPSPTPSREDNDVNEDHKDEVSSCAISKSVERAKPTNFPGGSVAFSGANSDELDGKGRDPEVLSTTSSSTDNQGPKCQVVGLEVSSSAPNISVNVIPVDEHHENEARSDSFPAKHPADEVPALNPAKRQKNVFSAPSVLMNPQLDVGKGGETIVPIPQFRGMEMPTHSQESDGRTSGNEKSLKETLINHAPVDAVIDVNAEKPVTSGAQGATPLPLLLKTVANNPKLLLQLKKTIEAQSQLNSASQSSQNSNASLLSTFVKSSAPAKSDLERPLQSSDDDRAKVRMKPRDPRRALQKMTQRGYNASDKPKRDGVLRDRERISVREKSEQSSACVTSQSVQTPVIAPELSVKLKNIADSIAELLNPLLNSVNVRGMPQVDSTAKRGSFDQQQRTAQVLAGKSALAFSQQQNPWGSVDHLFAGYDEQQRLAIQKERSRRIEEQNKMFSAKKLSLVLDLDHTLLNSAKFNEVDPLHDEILRRKEDQDKEKPQRHLFRFPHMAMWTKLRPGIWNFLEKASKLYELHLYTMGNKLYATEMAKVLDPTGKLFSGRVISRGGDGTDPLDADDRVPKSKDLEGVLGLESAVLIIDDSLRVWPHNKLNLILVERYTYFPCSRRQFGLTGPSLLEIDHDERPEEGTLASSLAVIERIHQDFFSHPCLSDIDVRNILALEQRKILAGCCIVFSRIFPVGEAKPHLHPLWQTAEQFGAVCTTVIDNQVTHVVANSLGTDKVNWALSTGRFVVHPGWVEASALLYRRANEGDFTVQI